MSPQDRSSHDYNNDSYDYISDTPTEILETILLNLSPTDLLRVQGVCQRWKAVIRHSVGIQRALWNEPEARLKKSESEDHNNPQELQINPFIAPYVTGIINYPVFREDPRQGPEVVVVLDKVNLAKLQTKLRCEDTEYRSWNHMILCEPLSDSIRRVHFHLISDDVLILCHLSESKTSSDIIAARRFANVLTHIRVEDRGHSTSMDSS